MRRGSKDSNIRLRVSGSFVSSTLLLTAVGYFIFYTDIHDVDEDLTSIPIHGGRWSAVSQAGIVRRSMNDSPTAEAGDIVASM